MAFGHSRLRQLATSTFTVLFFVAGALLINDGRSLLGVLAVAWGFIRIFGVQPAWREAVSMETARLSQELEYNVLIGVRISVAAVLEYSAVRALFDRLKELNRVHVVTASEWTTSLLEQYRARTGNQSLEHAVFRVRSNIV